MRKLAFLATLVLMTSLVAAEEPAKVEGTAWAGKDSEGRAYTFRFLPDGKLDYTSPEGTFRNGTWKQTGRQVTWEINNKFIEYIGTLAGEVLAGNAVNKLGKKKTFSLRRQGSPPTPTKPAFPAANSLANTVWTAVDKDEQPLVLRFQPDGKLEYVFGGETFRNGTWRQEGDAVAFEMNNKYVEYEGKRSGQALAGSAKDQKGQTWKWKASPGEPASAKPAATATRPVPTPPEPTAPKASMPAATSPEPKPSQTKPAPRPTEAMPVPTLPLPQPTRTMAGPLTLPDKPPPISVPTQSRPEPTRPEPTRPLPPATTAPQAPAVPEVAGTLWRGKDSDGDPFEFELKAGGRGVCRRGAILTTDVRWRQDGERLFIDVNNGYSRYEGRLLGDRAEGTGSNVQGRSWKWTMTRQNSKYDLAGSTWSGKDSDGEAFSFKFLENGEVDFIRDKETRKATWKIEGDKLIISVNKGFSTYVGLLNGEQIDGTATNIKGMRWNWRVKRQKERLP